MLKQFLAMARRAKGPLLLALFALSGVIAQPILAAAQDVSGPGNGVRAVSRGAEPGIQLLDTELVVSGVPVLQNDSGTVRIEDSRLGRAGPPVFVPEPDVLLLQLASLMGLLALVAGHRPRRVSRVEAGRLAFAQFNARKPR